MSSNPLIVDYEGGDLLLAGATCGRLLGHFAGLCLQAMGGDLITAWRLSFSDEMRVRGVLYMRRSVQIDVLLTHYAVGSRHIKSAISPKRLKIERNLL